LLTLKKTRSLIPSWRPSVATGLQADCIDYKRLKKMAGGISTVDVSTLPKMKRTAEGIIDPRWGDIIGPIDAFKPHREDPPPYRQQSDHYCFGDRFTLVATPKTEHEALRSVIMCSERCPTRDTSPDWATYSPPAAATPAFVLSSPPPALDDDPEGTSLLEFQMREHDNLLHRLNVPINAAPDAPSQPAAPHSALAPLSTSTVAQPTASQVVAEAARSRSPSVQLYEASRPVRAADRLASVPRIRSPSVEIYDPDPMLQPLSVISDRDLARWLSPVTGGDARFRSNVATVHIEADDLRSGARAVIAVLQHTHTDVGQTFELPDGVTQCYAEGIEPVSFIDQRTNIAIGPAVGPAPRHGVWGEMKSLMGEETSVFMNHHGSYTIAPAEIPGTSTSRRQSRFSAWGSFFAVHILDTHRGPQQTSFALVLAMVLPPDQFIRLPLPYIERLDPEAARLLRPWMSLPKTGRFPTSYDPANTPHERDLIHTLCEMGTQVCHTAALVVHSNAPKQPSSIDDGRSEAAHDMYTEKFFCQALLGVLPAQVWGHPDFQAFKAGFNIRLKFGDPSAQRFLSLFPPSKSLALVAALWGPRPVTAATLHDRLQVEVPLPTNQQWKDTAVLFLRCVRRYLEGQGHPEHETTREFAGISAEDFDREATNPHIRPSLLLETFTESKLCPTDDVPWALQVPVHRHLLQKIIKAAPEAPGKTTDFDAWLHCEMIGALKFFNRS
ncbi:hypothetical protein HWV62_1933, partial [Athelia sp. TMB]